MVRGAIALCLVLLASSVLAGAEQPYGNHTWCDGSGACYSAHLTPLPFSSAQEACAQRGGELSPASEEAEVRAILALLRALAAEPGSWLFWLGLRRAAQSCTRPDLPLRGFGWTAGAERAPQEELVKWLKEPSKSCTTERCAGLRVTAGRQDMQPWGWEERRCKTSTRGYVCKYRYDGACPAPRPQGARSLLYSLPYGLHSAALDFSPPGTELLVACPAPRGDVRLLCERGPDGYSWAGAGERLCPCPSGYRNRTGACVGPGDCISARGAFLCECAPGFLLGADRKSCLRPAIAPSSLPRGSSPAPAPRSSPAGEVTASASASASTGYVVLLVTMAVVTVVILAVVMLGLFKICFPKTPSLASPACQESELEATGAPSDSETSLEAKSKEAGGDPAEIA